MTTRKPPSNLAASVRGRLLNLSRQRSEEFQLVLSDYAIERFLYRLTLTLHRDDFVLKGAKLLRVWSIDQYRATWDLDLWYGDAISRDEALEVIQNVCRTAVDDGLHFDLDSIVVRDIGVPADAQPLRVHLVADLGAKIPMQIDIGIDDAIIPAPRHATYPTMLDQPAPETLVYPREAVIAEKLEAMVSLGQTNSRMKDFYDVSLLARTLPFDGVVLGEAIRATFAHRHTTLPNPEAPILSRAFHMAPDRIAMWRSFVRRSRVSEQDRDVTQLVGVLETFLHPMVAALNRDERFGANWPPGGPWQ